MYNLLLYTQIKSSINALNECYVTLNEPLRLHVIDMQHRRSSHWNQTAFGIQMCMVRSCSLYKSDISIGMQSCNIFNYDTYSLSANAVR